MPLDPKARFPGDSQSPLSDSPGWEAWHGVQNLHNSARTSLVLLFSSLWVTHPTGMVFDFIMIAPLLLSLHDFFFGCGCGVSFLVCSSILLSMVVQQVWFSHWRRWAHILLQCHLKPEAKIQFITCYLWLVLCVNLKNVSIESTAIKMSKFQLSQCFGTFPGSCIQVLPHGDHWGKLKGLIAAD